MPLEIVIQGLNMTAVNALIWTMTVLGKITIFATVFGGLLWLIMFALSMLSD